MLVPFAGGELDIRFTVVCERFKVFVQTLGCLLGKKEVVVAEDDVDHDLPIQLRIIWSEVLDDLLDHDEGLARLLRLADERKFVLSSLHAGHIKY